MVLFVYGIIYLFIYFFRDELSNLVFKENKICYSN